VRAPRHLQKMVLLWQSNVRLDCASVGRPQPSIEWYRDGHHVDSAHVSARARRP